MILEVIIEPFFVDTLVNCLGEGAPWVPLDAEEVVGQWVNKCQDKSTRIKSPSGVNDPFIGVVSLR